MGYKIIFMGLAIIIVGCKGSNQVLSTKKNTSSTSSLLSNNQNVNIDNPTLTIFDNRELTDSKNLKLVWSEEFSSNKLSPETWYFE